jgi:general secretion pathway protein G
MTRPKRGGFTLFEFVVAMVVVAVLTALVLNRLQTYQREAEQVAVQRLVGTLRTALSVRIAQLSVAKKKQELLSIIDENPMDWLVEPPRNYLGEYYSPEENLISDGVWYFDRRSKELVYTASEPKTFGHAIRILLKFKVKFVYLPVQQGKTPGLPTVIAGAVLDQV